MTTHNLTKEQTFKAINTNSQALGYDPLDIEKINKVNHTAALIIDNFATILHKFRYNFIDVVKDRVNRSYAHIEVRHGTSKEFIYVSSAYRSIMKDGNVRQFLMFRKELIDVWMSGNTFPPSILSFVNDDRYVYLSSADFRNFINESYENNKEDGLLFYQDSKASKWVLVEVPGDRFEQRFAEYPADYSFNTLYLPKFIKIPRVKYATRILGHSGVVKIGYYGAGIKWEEYTFKSFGEATEFINHQGIEVSYRTLMRYAKADKLYRLGPNKKEYDYLYIMTGDKELPNETPTVVKENPHRVVVNQATEEELPEADFEQTTTKFIDAEPDTGKTTTSAPEVVFYKEPNGDTFEEAIGIDVVERKMFAKEYSKTWGYNDEALARIRQINMNNFKRCQ